ncbi:hypothetical protein HA402_016080 [Bradysia odoriphaga]|nr:hypothetical protein HA402_016080 [Bradysia odoriphaga]
MTFNISAEINVSLRNMAMNILPLANYYTQVQRFILIVSSGATLRTLTYDYFHTLVQLEDDIVRMNLNRLHHCLRPSMRAMALLAEVVSDIARSESVGAKVLTVLCDKVSLLTGDGIGQQILVDLVEAAAVPYFETLERWILKGVIIDPQREFMIEDNEVDGLAEIDDISVYQSVIGQSDIPYAVIDCHRSCLLCANRFFAPGNI